MPFSELGGITEQKWTEIFEELFKPTILEANLNYDVERSEIRNGAFTKDIVENLKNSHVVLADITYVNANVMWELGVRHALSKRTIIVARNDVIQLISDLKIYGVIPYNDGNITEINNFKKKIKDILLDIEKDPERKDSPVFDFINEETLILSSFEKRHVMGRLAGLISELIFNLDCLNTVNKNKQPDTFENRIFRFSSTALDLLISDNYVTLSPKDLLTGRVILMSIGYFNNILEMYTHKKINKDTYDVINPKFVEFEKNMKEFIKTINEKIKYFRTNELDWSEPSVVVFRDEHQKLLE